MNGYYVKREMCLGDPVFYSLYRKLFEHNNQADPRSAWCLMREYSLKEPGKKDADLMMIYANEKGYGLGLELLNRIKNDYEIIRTQWDGSTVQGRELCLKAGFIREENLLTWRKENANAVQKSKTKGEILSVAEGGENQQKGSGGMGEGHTQQATS